MITNIERVTLQLTISKDEADIIARALSVHGQSLAQRCDSKSTEILAPMVKKLNTIFGFRVISDFKVREPAAPTIASGKVK